MDRIIELQDENLTANLSDISSLASDFNGFDLDATRGESAELGKTPSPLSDEGIEPESGRDSDNTEQVRIEDPTKTDNNDKLPIPAPKSDSDYFQFDFELDTTIDKSTELAITPEPPIEEDIESKSSPDSYNTVQARIEDSADTDKGDKLLVQAPVSDLDDTVSTRDESTELSTTPETPLKKDILSKSRQDPDCTIELGIEDYADNDKNNELPQSAPISDLDETDDTKDESTELVTTPKSPVKSDIRPMSSQDSDCSKEVNIGDSAKAEKKDKLLKSSPASDFDDEAASKGESSKQENSPRTPVKRDVRPRSRHDSDFTKQVRIDDSANTDKNDKLPKTPFRRSRKVIDTPVRRSARLAAKKKSPMMSEDDHVEF